eukprot:5798509-Prymnesium_polylepis.2
MAFTRAALSYRAFSSAVRRACAASCCRRHTIDPSLAGGAVSPNLKYGKPAGAKYTTATLT